MRFPERFLDVVAARRSCRFGDGAGGGRRPTKWFIEVKWKESMRGVAGACFVVAGASASPRIASYRCV
jgi:hypothetical protein